MANEIAALACIKFTLGGHRNYFLIKLHESIVFFTLNALIPLFLNKALPVGKQMKIKILYLKKILQKTFRTFTLITWVSFYIQIKNEPEKYA